MDDQKITREFIVKTLEKWIENHKGQILPLSFEAVEQLYKILTEDK